MRKCLPVGGNQPRLISVVSLHKPNQKKETSQQEVSFSYAPKLIIYHKKGAYSYNLFAASVFCYYLCKQILTQHNHIMANQKLDRLDKQILKLIAEDARIPFLEVARICDVSGAAIHQRIQKLTNMGILKGSQFIIDPEKVGYETCAFIGLNLKNPESFDEVVEKLKMIPEVVECHYTTGDYDLFIKIYAINNHHLLNIIHDKLQPLGLARSESIISFHSAIDRRLPIREFTKDEE